MKLFDRYQNRALQAALDLLSLARAQGGFTRQEADRVAQRCCLSYSDQLLPHLCQAGILTKTREGYTLSDGFTPFSLPPGQLERDYLQYILRLPEAALLLPPELREKLSAPDGADVYEPIQLYAPRGASTSPDPRTLQAVLQAIRQGRMIRYSFRTRDAEQLQQAEALPWKLEYSAYDRRWWVILYDPLSGRTVKARLENLRDVELLGSANIPEDTVLQAVESLLEPEPVVLRVKDLRGGLERTFLVLEHQLFSATRLESDGACIVTFRYYRFDYGELLRRLLYLGPAVTLLGPSKMRRDLLALVDQALAAQA